MKVERGKMKRLIIGCLTALLAACQASETMEHAEGVELTFRLTSGAASTRGNVSDYPSTPEQWTQAERAADGRYLYTVSVYIVDGEGKIAAQQENIPVDNQAEEKVVTFDKSYGLKRGEYKLLAVANHTDHTIGETTYSSGLTTDNIVTTQQGTQTEYEALMGNLITAHTDNLSPKNVIQPLSLVKEIELHAGNNEVEGELVRTFARLRIELKNNSGSTPLKVKSVTFSDNFCQQQAYVFDDGTNRKYFDPTGAPLATSAHALQPFALDANADHKSIPAQTAAVVFDSYLLESQVPAGEKYTYTLDLAYEGVSTPIHTYTRSSSTAIDRPSNLNVGSESYFLIYNTSSERYLSAADGVVTTVSLDNNTLSTSLSTSHVWQVIATGSGTYYIKNVETGLYMQLPGSSSVAMGATQASYTLQELTGWNGNYIGLQGYGSYYVGVYESWNRQGRTYNVQGYNQNNNSQATRFRFYPVTKTTSGGEPTEVTHNKPITLTTIDPVTQQAVEATAIKRNDFINVLVTTSYNPEEGTFEFYVEDWQSGGGNVEFN